MTSITYIGMDVHTTNYTLCAYTIAGQQPFAQTTINPDVKELLKYLDRLNKELGGDCEFICGYEAGCLGYSLYHELAAHGVSCIILAPSTMPTSRNEQIKTDKRDAVKIAKCLAYGTYSSVYVPTAEDNAIKEYIRMRDDAKQMMKQTKQQILALCTRNGKSFDGKTHWTHAHVVWLYGLDFDMPILKETLKEYLLTYEQLSERIAYMDKRIEEFAQQETYAERVRQLSCFKGIKTHTALSLIVEVGDFQRFPTAQQFSAFLGLVPCEHSSGDSQHRFGITKTGNAHLRRLLTEAANGYCRCATTRKSAVLKARQAGNRPEIIAYADRANERLRKKYIRIMMKSKANVAKIAVARELSCFIWGMMNGKIA